MKLKLISIPVILFFSHLSVLAIEVAKPPIDSLKTIKEVALEGKISGHFRDYFMSTINNEGLSDHYANATGFELNYESAKFKGFNLGISGSFTFNTFSSNLNYVDPISNKITKLETELFDTQDIENKSNVNRLDKLYLNFETKKIQLLLGRFIFDSPLINPQDGRMITYSSQGLNANIAINKVTKLKLAAFNGFSPRGTIKWYSISDVIGIYSSGVNSDGSPAKYHGNTHANVVLTTGFETKFGKSLKVDLWNYLIDNVSNTAYLKTELNLNKGFMLGFEAQQQHQIGNGGNQAPSLAYFNQKQSFLYGSKIEYQKNSFNISLNYLKITDAGKFLFPKEFGREQFFVTTPRGRFEGLSNTDVLMLKSRLNLNKQWGLELNLGKAWLPTYNVSEENKYGASSYNEIITDVVYVPKTKVLEGLNFKFLYINKIGVDNIPLANQYYNINYQNINFVAEFKF
ncbi:MAG: porin [Sphingobacteriales bacterium]|nr:porin [Sphingobacteriales bacterium]